jgi:hypothetical protein
MDDSEWRVDWEDGDSSNELEEVQEDREREEVIKNPDPDEEHQIHQRVRATFNWYYEYKPEIDDFEYSHQEEYEEGTPEGIYRCTCCLYEMSDSEALEHIKRANSKS